KSVGIDIGSSTSHLIFSKLTLRREGAALSARFKVTGREILFRSRIMLTPYISGTSIDTEKVKAFVREMYREAGFTAADIDTGAVVITGEALKKENAKPIVEFFARESGKFICASAGPNHEALLAAYGCGAVELSRAHKATVLNVDMGGGTTKFSLIRDGVVTQTAAINIGARLVAFDPGGVLIRIEEPARTILKELGYSVALGSPLAEQAKEPFASLMAKVVFEVIEARALSPLAGALMITEPFSGYNGLAQLDHIVFSGGVSEHIYERDHTAYGDMGPLLARAIRERLARIAKKNLLREPSEGIRATVIGAGEYTIQASGNTSYISSADVLPAFGLKVVRPFLDEEGSVEEAVERALAKFDLAGFIPGLALAVSLSRQPDYPLIRRLAEGIAKVIGKAPAFKTPLFLTMDLDVAKSLGGVLKEELNVQQEVIAVDGIDVGDLDYIDIGRPMGVSEVVPVTVKSLMFPSLTSKA
ncbi:MAG TPA: ethanolamine ammonia-lyase reactivating factor EutA, partial [Candidatus Binatia bacterium]